MGGDTGLIAIAGKGGKGPLALTPKEFGAFVNLMKELVKSGEQLKVIG